VAGLQVAMLSRLDVAAATPGLQGARACPLALPHLVAQPQLVHEAWSGGFLGSLASDLADSLHGFVRPQPAAAKHGKNRHMRRGRTCSAHIVGGHEVAGERGCPVN